MHLWNFRAELAIYLVHLFKCTQVEQDHLHEPKETLSTLAHTPWDSRPALKLIQVLYDLIIY